MAEKLLQIHFKLITTPREYHELASHVAPAIAALPGLRWKVWTLNESRLEGGGVYLFENQQALDAYVTGDIIAALKSHPGVRDVTLTQSDVMTDVTATTRGPVGAVTMA